MMKKKLTTFSRNEVLRLEEILFEINECNSCFFDYLIEKLGDRNIRNSLDYLCNNGYCMVVHENPIHDSDDDQYDIKQKGSVLCDQGGLLQLYDKNIGQNKAYNLSKWSIVIALSAFIFSILTFLFK